MADKPLTINYFLFKPCDSRHRAYLFNSLIISQLGANMLNLWMEFNAVFFPDGVNDALLQGDDFLRRGVAGGVHNHEGLVGVHLRAAQPHPLESALVDHPRGGDLHPVTDLIMRNFTVRSVLFPRRGDNPLEMLPADYRIAEETPCAPDLLRIRQLLFPDGDDRFPDDLRGQGGRYGS